ncbi:MAG TPA: hypothetical protein PLE78_05720 [Flavobacteriales bacterium]|nr:hypothetical protein [Flavobacteriales bacterium]HQW41619.1 hypothetical protein [Flavobacteriales bacterium]
MLTTEIDIAGEGMLLHTDRALFLHYMRWLALRNLHMSKAHKAP